LGWLPELRNLVGIFKEKKVAKRFVWNIFGFPNQACENAKGINKREAIFASLARDTNVWA
jgi:hypothetical protein